MDRKLDYYGLLGLDRRASLSDIRSAFRKFALQFHPDRSPDLESQARFRKISEAYDILSNPESRKIYDESGWDGLRGRTIRDYETEEYSSMEVFGDPAEMGVFEDVSRRRYNPEFWKDSPFGDLSAVGRGGRGANLRVEIEIGIEEAANGTWKNIEIIREELCTTCKGSGSKPGSRPLDCPRCRDFWFNYGKPELLRRNSRCPECGGRGKKIIFGCDQCRGAGTVAKKRTLKVIVPAASKDGDRIRMAGYGDHSFLGGRSGDLTIDLHVRKGGRA